MPVDVKPSIYIPSSKEINLQIGDIFTISKYKKNLQKGYVPSWSEEVFLVKYVKNTVPWTYHISDLKGGELLEPFMKKN